MRIIKRRSTTVAAQLWSQSLCVSRRVLAPELTSEPQPADGFKRHEIGMIGLPTSVIPTPGRRHARG